MGLTDFFRKIGILKASKGDYRTGDIDSGKKEESQMEEKSDGEDVKKKTEEEVV